MLAGSILIYGSVLCGVLPVYGQTCDTENPVQLVVCPVVHAEGPNWDSDAELLYFVDITNQTVNSYDPKTRQTHQVYIDGGPISPVIPVEFTTDKFVIGRGLDLVWMEWDGKSATPSKTEVLTSVDKNKPNNRFNDGKVDSSGRIWAGTIGPEDPDLVLNQGSLYSFNHYNNFAPTQQVFPVSVSNGLAWNDDDTLMYYIDSPKRKVEVFDFDINNAEISNRRTHFDLDKHNIPGVPDGMAIDHQGNLWVAIFNGGRIIQVDGKTGDLLKTVPLPVAKVTSCAFGGKDLTTLYITTSRIFLTEEELKAQPKAGAVFSYTENNLKGQDKNNKIRI